MISSDGSLIYIENFRLLKSFLDNSTELSKLRSKIDNNLYSVNGLLAKKIGNIWTVSFLAPERRKPTTWVLSDTRTLHEFKGLFGDILVKENILLPVFLKFSGEIDNNIFVNLEVKNFLYNVFSEAGGFKEES